VIGAEVVDIIMHACYNANVTVVSETQTIIRSKKLALTFKDTKEVNVNDMIPGKSVEKTFEVENTGDDTVTYNIKWKDIASTYNEDLVYTLTRDGEILVQQTLMPKTNPEEYILTNVSIDAGVIHDYVLKIEFLYTDEYQGGGEALEFTGTVEIDVAKIDTEIIHVPYTTNEITSINQETPDKVSFESGNDMTLNSAEENVGDPAKYLQVSVGGELNAEAPNGGVYIGTPEDLTIGKIEAGQDVVVDAIGSISQSDDLVSKPAISAGNDITLTSQKEDVGAKDNFLTVDFGGQLDVKAEEGSAYIEGMGALDIDSIVAAEDLGVRTPESIIADNVNAGRDLILESGKDVELFLRHDQIF